MLALSSKAARQVDFAIDELSAGRLRQALQRLCYLRGIRQIPELRANARPVIQRLAPPMQATLSVDSEAQRAHLARSLEPVTPLVKPTKRHADRDALADFRARFPYCAVRKCPNGEVDPHHIVERSKGGASSDDERNLLNLCRWHHAEWHEIGCGAFVEEYADRLQPTDLLKIRLAALLEAEAKLGTRPAADLEA